MGIVNTFLDFMRLNEDDDEFDNEDYDEFEDEEDDSRIFPHLRRKKKEEEPVTRQSFGTVTSKADSSSDSGMPYDADETQQKQQKIIPMRRTSAKKEDPMEVCVIVPKSLDDEREIAETLLQGHAVLINMEGQNLDMAQRIIDFTSGAAFAIRGTMQKVSNFIFIAAPQNIDISGDLPSLLEDIDNGSSFTI